VRGGLIALDRQEEIGVHGIDADQTALNGHSRLTIASAEGHTSTRIQEAIFVRTTLDLPDDVLRKGKIAAVECGFSFRQLVIDALIHEIQGRGRTERQPPLAATQVPTSGRMQGLPFWPRAADCEMAAFYRGFRSFAGLTLRPLTLAS
jgi:hypothetical protein